MVATIKFGRKRYKNLTANIIEDMKGMFTFQTNMWYMIESSFKRFKRSADIQYKLGDDNIQVNIRNEKQSVDDTLDIEWLIIDFISESYQRELEEYNKFINFDSEFKKIFDNMKKNNSNIEINKSKFNIVNMLKITKEQIDKWIEVGLDKTRNKSISDVLIELDIVIVKLEPEKK